MSPAPLNNSIVITCVANGLPNPLYTLSHKGKKLLINVTEVKYTIDSVRVYHSGVYECLAVNIVGNDTKEFNLVVEGKIVIDLYNHQCMTKCFNENVKNWEH